jgi:hypothetical protein
VQRSGELSAWMAALTIIFVVGSRRHREASRLPLSWIGILPLYIVARIVWPDYVVPHLPLSWYTAELVAMSFGLSIITVAWSIVDGRLALAIAISSAMNVGFFDLVNLLHGPLEVDSTGWAIAEYTFPVVVAAVGVGRLRRQSAL